MNDLIRVIPYLLATTLVASVHGSLCYALCRWIERKWTDFPTTILTFLLVFLVVTSDVGISYNIPNKETLVLDSLRAALVWYGPLALLGGWFHRRSGGASQHLFAAELVVMMAICLSSLPLLGLLVYKPSIVPEPLPYEAIFAFYFLGTCLYPMLAPLGLWVWRSR
ncbi:hypothetical protein EON80_29610 [bacterium]|nr:MAG: hypothetical protein EON80_29610 [bacterium]